MFADGGQERLIVRGAASGNDDDEFAAAGQLNVGGVVPASALSVTFAARSASTETDLNSRKSARASDGASQEARQRKAMRTAKV